MQAQAVARLVMGGDAEHYDLPAWVAWAPTVSVRKLEETVSRALLLRAADPEGRDPEHPERIAGEDVDPERQTCARPMRSGESIRLALRAWDVDERRLRRSLGPKR